MDFSKLMKDMFGSNTASDQIDPEMTRLANKTCDEFTESMYAVANEPTVACYRIQEHIHSTIPKLISRKTEMNRNETILKGILYDAEYTKDSISSISRSKEHFDSIQQLLKRSIELNNQMNVRRRERPKTTQQQQQSEPIRRSSPRSSAPKMNRFSASFDFPTVASSMSADLKSLINQFTTNSKESSPGRANVPSSKSLHRLPENNPGDDDENTSNK